MWSLSSPLCSFKVESQAFDEFWSGLLTLRPLQNLQLSLSLGLRPRLLWFHHSVCSWWFCSLFLLQLHIQSPWAVSRIFAFLLDWVIRMVLPFFPLHWIVAFIEFLVFSITLFSVFYSFFFSFSYCDFQLPPVSSSSRFRSFFFVLLAVILLPVWASVSCLVSLPVPAFTGSLIVFSCV